MPKVLHPHITSNPAICGGAMCIAGTRIAVRTIAIAALRYGQTPEEILASYPHLTLASIHDALSCYYDNREEIDKEITDFEALDPGLHRH